MAWRLERGEIVFFPGAWGFGGSRLGLVAGIGQCRAGLSYDALENRHPRARNNRGSPVRRQDILLSVHAVGTTRSASIWRSIRHRPIEAGRTPAAQDSTTTQRTPPLPSPPSPFIQASALLLPLFFRFLDFRKARRQAQGAWWNGYTIATGRTELYGWTHIWDSGSKAHGVFCLILVGLGHLERCLEKDGLVGLCWLQRLYLYNGVGAHGIQKLID